MDAVHRERVGNVVSGQAICSNQEQAGGVLEGVIQEEVRVIWPLFVNLKGNYGEGLTHSNLP